MEQHVEAAVVDHVGQAFGWVFRVEGHVGRAAFQCRQQADDQLRTATHGQADTLAGAGAVVDQALGQVVGLCIELAVAQGVAVHLQCQCTGRGSGSRGDLFVGQ